MMRSPAALAALLSQRRRHRPPPASPYTIATDDLEGNLYWTHSGTGTDHICELSAAQQHAGAQSLHVATRLTGAAPGDLMVAHRAFNWVETHHLIQSVWLMLPDPSKLQYLWWWEQLNKITAWYHPHIAWWISTGEASYWDAAGTPIAVPALDHVWVAGTWTHLTVEISTQSKQYIAATIGAASADLSGLPFQQQTGACPDNFQAELGLATSGAAVAHAYLDDLSITATWP